MGGRLYMNKRVNISIVILAIIAVISVLYYALSPYIDSYRANKYLNISGVELLMTNSEVEKVLGKGENIGGFGAAFYKYQNETVTIAYPVEGLLKGRVGQIDIKNSEYSIFGVHPGDSIDKAKVILKKHGFKQDRLDSHHFIRGSAKIYIYGDSVRIDIEDWTIRGHVY